LESPHAIFDRGKSAAIGGWRDSAKIAILRQVDSEQDASLNLTRYRDLLPYRPSGMPQEVGVFCGCWFSGRSIGDLALTSQMPGSRRGIKRIATVANGPKTPAPSADGADATPDQPGNKPAQPRDQTEGLTLDEYLHAAADMRRTFQLANPPFSLRDVESQAGASVAVRAIVDETIERHGSEIYAKQHELLDSLGREVYGDWTQSLIYSGYRISRGSMEQALRRTIEVGLQVAAQLPAKDHRQARLPNLRTLAKGCERLAGKLNAALQHEEFRARMRIFTEDNIGNAASLPKLGGELRRGPHCDREAQGQAHIVRQPESADPVGDVFRPVDHEFHWQSAIQ
jgi:hypothetical protein